jgi:glycosyltransferase involved in cell wall biosynthesis
MRRTLFVCRRHGLGSAQVRAVQIAEALGCPTLSVRQLTPEAAAGFDAIVYVKTFPDRAVLERIRRKGVKQVFDPVDEYRWWKIWARRSFVDAFIGANLTHAIWLEKRFGAPAVELPHHHCNFEELRIPPRRSPPTLGYIADAKRWRANRRIARRLGLPLVTSLNQSQGRQGLAELYLAVDIGFEFRKASTDRRFKPATKVVNFMSYGIPSVLGFETGYTEVALHGEHCLYAHSPREMVLLLERLARDADLRVRMGEAGFEAARRYHIREIAGRYRAFLSDL